MQNNCSSGKPVYAGFWVRLAAYLADSVIVWTGLLICRITMSGVFQLISRTPFDGNVLFEYTWKDIILYLTGSAYYVLCVYCAGTTAGKRLFNLRVVSADSEKLSFTDVLYRETVGKFLSGVVLCIGYLMAGIDHEKRALHDILCDTRVIYAKRVKITPVGPQQRYAPPREAQVSMPVMPAQGMPVPPAEGPKGTAAEEPHPENDPEKEQEERG